MAYDMFIEIDGIEGESGDEAHAGHIDVLAWSWGASNSGSAHLGGGQGAGKVQVRDLEFTHYIDKASPTLFLVCCNGKHIPKATLTVRKAGETPLEYLVITMEELLVTGVTTGGAGTQDRLTETVRLNFGKFEIKYTPQKTEGAGEAEVTTSYDIRKNK